MQLQLRNWKVNCNDAAFEKEQETYLFIFSFDYRSVIITNWGLFIGEIETFPAFATVTPTTEAQARYMCTLKLKEKDKKDIFKSINFQSFDIHIRILVITL